MYNNTIFLLYTFLSSPSYLLVLLSSMSSLAEGRVQWSKLDVAISNRSIRVLALNIRRHTTRDRTISSSASQIGVRVLISWIGRVKPEHVAVVIIPQTHDKNHTVGKCLGHVCHTTLLLERVSVAKYLLLLVAELRRDGVAVNAWDSGCRLRNSFAALNVETLDLHGIACSDELCDDGEFLGCVNGLAFAVEVLDSHAIAVEVAAIRIADTSIAICRIGTTAGIASATRLLNRGARVWGNGRADRIRFPDVHFCAAGAEAANTCILIVIGWLPAFNIALRRLLAYS